MALLRVVVASDPTTLLEQATQGLFSRSRGGADASSTAPAWLVLRQGGLRDDVRRRASESGADASLDGALCLFAELSTRWSSAPARPMVPEERTALLSVLMARHGGRVFSRSGNTDAWVTAADAIVGDLVSDGVTPDAFHAALNARAGRDSFEVERDAALSALYRDYDATIARHERCDGRDELVRLARSIESDHLGFAAKLGGRRDVRIVGLADMRGGWRSLLEALVHSPVLDTVSVFTTCALDVPSTLEAQTIAIDGVLPQAHCAVHALEAPDSAREIEIVATRVQALLDAGGTPSRIAVVSREARPTVDDMAAALDRLGVPVTARRRVALSCTGPARALRALLGGAAAGWPLRALIEIAENPLLRMPFDREVLHILNRMAPLASPGDLTDALTALMIRCRTRDQAASPGRHELALPETSRVASTLDELRGFHAQRLEAGHARTTDEWLAWTVETLTGTAWDIDAALDSPNVDPGIAGIDIRARDRIVEIAMAWRTASALFGDPIDETSRVQHGVSAEAFARVLSSMLAEDIVLQPDTETGVMVSEALASAWRAFDHVFIVGLSDGVFPSRPPRSPVLGDVERASLVANGLPLDPPDAWRARERELFRVLCAAPAVSLTLSWPAVDGDGGELVRSGYIDEFGLHQFVHTVPAHEVLTNGFPIVARSMHRDALAHAQRAADTERLRERSLSPYNGAISEPELLRWIGTSHGVDSPWSATSIEELAKCPWQWMAKRLLKLEERDEADDAIEPTTTGTVLHRALERFFDDARERTGGPVFLRATDAEWVAPLVEQSLTSAWEEESRRSWMGVPVMRDLVRAELLHQLRKYIRFEIAHNEKSFNNRSPVSKNIRTGAMNGELQFEHVIDVDGTSFRLRGTIDRVDVGIDERVPNASAFMVAIDYKSSRGSTPAGGSKRGWDDGVVLQVPLYAAAIRQHFPERTLARLEYRTLRNPEIVHPLQFVKLGKPGKSGACEVLPADGEAQLHAALHHAARHIDDARSGKFPARPVPSCGCSPFCPARDACRIPGGPVEGMR